MGEAFVKRQNVKTGQPSPLHRRCQPPPQTDGQGQAPGGWGLRKKTVLKSMESLVSCRCPGKVNPGGGQGCKRSNESAVVVDKVAVKVAEPQESLQLFERARHQPRSDS